MTTGSTTCSTRGSGRSTTESSSASPPKKKLQIRSTSPPAPAPTNTPPQRAWFEARSSSEATSATKSMKITLKSPTSPTQISRGRFREWSRTPFQQNREKSPAGSAHQCSRTESSDLCQNILLFVRSRLKCAKFKKERILFVIIDPKMDAVKKSALQVLEQTSRTFYIPIVKLPTGAQEAVASAYLCLRAIDQVQDHPSLPNNTKSQILKNISFSLQKYRPCSQLQEIDINWQGRQAELPQVTLRIREWLIYCPETLRARVADCTAAMADRMAIWAQRNWQIHNEADLDVYTFAVAGAVGLILCEIWEWFQGVKTDRALAIGYGRGLQSVNILRNSGEDLQRGVTFYPPGWTQKQMIQYSRKNLAFAEEYMKSLKQGSAANTFCEIPYALAVATVNIIQNGLPKLTRQQVMQICKITA